MKMFKSNPFYFPLKLSNFDMHYPRLVNYLKTGIPPIKLGYVDYLFYLTRKTHNVKSQSFCKERDLNKLQLHTHFAGGQ